MPDYTEQEMLIQDKVWELGIIELALTHDQWVDFVREIREHLDDRMSGSDKLVVHFTSKTCLPSILLEGMKVQKIYQLVNAEVVTPSFPTWEKSKLENAKEIVTYHDEIRAKLLE